jgi:1-deoxy-D-xylulose-5-phosphate reductoisomerase
LVQREAARCGATLLPVDSEHNAIFQVFDFERVECVEKLILTASGGPFRTRTKAEMAAVTPAEAVKHPNWSMGAKISIDSATMMNKGLELIEARYLFGVAPERLEVLVHPQSVIHSLVAYIDGSVLAQLGPPDMRTPIAFTLAWPSRMKTPMPGLDLAALGMLTFEAPDDERFPALRLARAAMVAGGAAPTVLNAANEIAVQAFLDERIGFLDIAETVEAILDRMPGGTIETLDDVHNFDKQAREAAITFTGKCRASRGVRGGVS